MALLINSDINDDGALLQSVLGQITLNAGFGVWFVYIFFK